MAVKIECSICGVFIKQVEPYEFQKLTGKEFCKDCGDKVNGVYRELDKLVDDLLKDVADKKKAITVLYNSSNEKMKRLTEELHSFHTTRKSELDHRMKEVIK